MEKIEGDIALLKKSLPILSPWSLIYTDSPVRISNVNRAHFPSRPGVERFDRK